MRPCDIVNMPPHGDFVRAPHGEPADEPFSLADSRAWNILGRAVDRNRVKRCVRESFRLVLPELPACDFVVRLLVKPTPGDEARDLMKTFKRAGQRAMAKWPSVAAEDVSAAVPESPPN
ncbi:MAG: hypothetical protein B7X93_04020 [Hydrogenophilales bacterium 17-61-9]|nr:MAG: hypothetical protein B7X93_04020 [Hydrogenophilales bacterium 17-61-9]